MCPSLRGGVRWSIARAGATGGDFALPLPLPMDGSSQKLTDRLRLDPSFDPSLICEVAGANGNGPAAEDNCELPTEECEPSRIRPRLTGRPYRPAVSVPEPSRPDAEKNPSMHAGHSP